MATDASKIIGRQMGLLEGQMTRLKQEKLFGPSLNPVSRLKAAMRRTMADSNLSRSQIVDRMNALAIREGLSNGRGSRITPAALDGWVAETKVNLIPISLLPIFCQAVDSLLPLSILAECLGASIINEIDTKLLVIASSHPESRDFMLVF
jgi:hypothetical protein